MIEVDPEPTLPRKTCHLVDCPCRMVHAASDRLLGQAELVMLLAIEPAKLATVYDFTPTAKKRRKD